MSTTKARSHGANLLPMVTVRTCSGDTKTISETKTLSASDENTRPKLPEGASNMGTSRMSILSLTYKAAFNILCGAVVVDVQLHAILGNINRVTGRMTLPKTVQKFKSYESLDYVAWTAVVDQTGYYPCSNWFFADYSTALKLKPGSIAEPFLVQQRFSECGSLDIIFWFAMEGDASDPTKGWGETAAPRPNITPHELGEDFDDTWCYGYEEAVKKFNDDDGDIVKRCLGLAYGGPDRWRTIERKLCKKLGFGLSEEQQAEEAVGSP